MAKKYKYKILINGGTSATKPFIYKFGRTPDVKIYTASQKGLITFQMSAKKEIEDLISFKVKLVRDALRKLYLVHALRHDKGLKIKTIEINIDGESWIFDENSQYFPFLFSMIKNRKQDLSPKWKELPEKVIGITKSDMDTDLRVCAMFSYLAAKNRSYRIDRFINLWTAMNAYGNYIAHCYENRLKEEFDFEKSSKSAKKDVLLYKKDGSIVKVLSLLLKYPLDFSATEDLWENYYGVESALMKLAPEDYPELYQEAYKALDDSYQLPEKYKAIADCAKRFNKPLFVFLLMDYPYHLRCNYLHGSTSTVLFSAYNDYEMASLGAINYCLETYLNEKIPEIFEEDFWTEDLYQTILKCMSIAGGTENNGKRKFDTAFNKLVKKVQ